MVQALHVRKLVANEVHCRIDVIVRHHWVPEECPGVPDWIDKGRNIDIQNAHVYMADFAFDKWPELRSESITWAHSHVHLFQSSIHLDENFHNTAIVFLRYSTFKHIQFPVPAFGDKEL